MPRLLRLTSFLLLALLVAPARAGDDKADPKGPDSADAPKDEPKKGEEPGKPKDEPTPPKDEPAPPKDEPAAPPKDPDDDNPFDKDQPAAPTAPTEQDPPDPVAKDLPAPPEGVAVPAGMVYVPPGTATVGSTAEQVFKLGEGRDAQVKADLQFETPPYTREMPGYFLGAGEVTNAQYLVFLRDTRTKRDTSKGAAMALPGWAAEFLRTPHEIAEKDERSWRQLYRANREALWAAMPDKVAKRADGTPDEFVTERNFHHAPLVKGITLTFYTRRIPDDWPGMEPDPKEGSRPVRWVSFFDAEAFAEWAGCHVPTEEEWEYAMRGPEGRFYPWGKHWDAARCNWAGRITYSEPEYQGTPLYLKPRTVDVFDPKFAAGRSWCGAWNGLGNVAEWTSSWFDRYPKTSPKREHAYLGKYVKIIRGGTLIDQDLLALRPAARNFVGAGPSAPPVPSNPFEYVGIRLARYLEAGRDAAVPAIRRAAKGDNVAESEFPLDRIAGASVTQDAPAGADVKDGIFVTGRAAAVVLAPRASILRADDKDTKLRNLRDLMTLSEENPVPLAVLHSDVPIAALKKVVPPADPADGRRRPKKEEEKFEAGVCPPGSYLLAVSHRRLVLTLSDLEVQCHLEEKAADQQKRIEQKSPSKDKEKPESYLALLSADADTDDARVIFKVPIGGPKAEDHFEVRFTLHFVTGALAKAGSWK